MVGSTHAGDGIVILRLRSGDEFESEWSQLKLFDGFRRCGRMDVRSPGRSDRFWRIMVRRERERHNRPRDRCRPLSLHTDGWGHKWQWRSAGYGWIGQRACRV